jgi:hypothetical protein
MSTAQITSAPRVVIASWIVFILFSVAIVTCVVLASLAGYTAPTDLPVGP